MYSHFACKKIHSLSRREIKSIARKKRDWFPGATYHVMGRGIRRIKIFDEHEDYEIFMKLVEMTQQKYPFDLHSYCLMTNHFHMLIETTNTEIWKIMKRILNAYSRTYNVKYGYSGHLFESRYASSIINDETYFLEVSRYIHLNPVRAKMVRFPLDYKYSSYQNYVTEKIDTRVTTEKILSCFQCNPAQQYQMFVESKITHEDYEKLIMNEMREDEMWLPW